MKFSIYLNPQTRGPEEDVPIIETTIRQAVKATQRGVAGITLTEHHFSGYNTYGSNLLMTANLQPQVPDDTMFFIAVAVPPLHNPLRLAQEINLLDILTHGNLIVGFAAGGSPIEYAGLGREPSVRHEQMFHNLEVMETALAKKMDDPAYEWETAFEHGSLRTRIMPSAFHADHPKFARGTQNDEGVEWTARKGWYLFTARETKDVIADRFALYRRTLEESKFTPQQIDELFRWSMVQKQIIVRDTDEEAIAFARERMVEMADHQRKSFGVTNDVKGAEHMKTVVGVSPQNPDEFLEKAMIVGSPETVRNQIKGFGDVGVQHMALLFNYGFMTAEQSGRSLDLFLDEVLPAFSDDASSGSAPVGSTAAVGR